MLRILLTGDGEYLKVPLVEQNMFQPVDQSAPLQFLFYLHPNNPLSEL